MNENEKQEAFDKWYAENYDEWAEGEEGIALREELEQAFKGGIAELEKENAELNEKLKPENCLKLLAKEGYIKFTCENGNEHDQLTKAKEIIKGLLSFVDSLGNYSGGIFAKAEQFISEVEK